MQKYKHGISRGSVACTVYRAIRDKIDINMDVGPRPIRLCTTYPRECMVENKNYNERIFQCEAKSCKESCIKLGYVTGVCLVPDITRVYEHCYCEIFKEHL